MVHRLNIEKTAKRLKIYMSLVLDERVTDNMMVDYLERSQVWD